MNTPDATKSAGSWDVRRKIKIPALGHEADGMAVQAAVGSLPGVCAVTVDVKKRRIIVRYDVTGSDYVSIEEALEAAGFPPLDNRLSRLKKGWYRFTEANARENAKAPPPVCCNKPPK